MREIQRGEIYLADLGEGVGSEQKGVRPVLIVQNNRGNKYSHDQKKRFRWQGSQRERKPEKRWYIYVSLAYKYGQA